MNVLTNKYSDNFVTEIILIYSDDFSTEYFKMKNSNN